MQSKSTGARWGAPYRPARTVAMVPGMTRRRKRQETKVPVESVRVIAREIQRRLPSFGTQNDIAQWLGVSQGQVSKFIGALKESAKPYEPGADVVAQVAEKLGIDYRGPSIGMRRAGVEESTDMLPNRGRALDILSAEYSAELLQALKRHPVEPEHEGWTHTKWLEVFVELKKAWERGLIDLPGLPRDKRG